MIGVSQVGTVYTGKTSKIAEHGGDNPQDRDVPIVVARLAHTGNGDGNADENGDDNDGDNGHLSSTPVETTQIAPTILRLLGLDPRALQSVQIEHTQPLPLG